MINIVKKGHVALLRLNGRDYLIEQKSTRERVAYYVLPYLYSCITVSTLKKKIEIIIIIKIMIKKDFRSRFFSFINFYFFFHFLFSFWNVTFA